MWCLNPRCAHPENLDTVGVCQSCGTSLDLLRDYKIVEPLRPLNKLQDSLFEVVEKASGESRVLRISVLDSPKTKELWQREYNLLRRFEESEGLPRVFEAFRLDLVVRNTKGLRQNFECGCLILERVEGIDLQKYVQQCGVVYEDQAIDWLKQILEILEVLHSEGFIHRDIKPSNIMLGPDGKLTLIDFGTSRELDDDYLEALSIGSEKTKIDSLGYSSQEQRLGRAVKQSDFFALGRTFVYLLTGIEPLQLRFKRRLQWRNRANISNDFAVLLSELMAPNPHNRPSNVKAIFWRVNHLRFNRVLRPIRSKRSRWGAVGAIVLGITGFLVYPTLAYQNLLKQARIAMAEQDYAKAEPLLKKALEHRPDNAVIHNDLGLTCEHQGKAGCRAFHFEKALELDPNLVEAHYGLGRYHDDVGDMVKAEQHYRAVLDQGGAISLAVRNDLARALILAYPEQSDSLIEAVSLTSQVLESVQEPRYRAAALKNRAWANSILREPEVAHQDFLEAIQLAPDRPDAYCLLAVLLENQGQLALDYWQKCLELDSKIELNEISYLKGEAAKRLN